MELNPYQERAVNVPGHCTILACPGSGKTRVLSARAARLLSSHDTGRLCAVTFTRDAARELKARILGACGEEHARRLAVGTFHALALAQIRRYGSRPVRLLSEGERAAVLRRCWMQHAPGVPFDDVVQAVDAAKASLTPAPFANPAIEDVFDEYQAILAAEDAVDFADLMLIAVREMESGTMPPLPVRWLLVDEAQDMDEVQMQWVLLHGQAGAEVTLVGDDDQSLYAFRHALGYTGLQEVTLSLSATETTLPVSYRSPPNILEHAAKLIAHNQNRAMKKITAHRQDAGEIRVVRVPDRLSEVDEIAAALRTGKEWAILARTNLVLDFAELALTEINRPYARSGGKSVWEHSAGSAFCGLLRSVLDDSWTGVSNALYFCGVQAEWINGHSRQSSGGCTERLASAIAQAPDDATRNLLLKLQGNLPAWRGQAAKRPKLVVHGIAAFLAEHARPGYANLLRKLEHTLASLPGSLPQRLSALRRPSADGGRPSVQIMTLHASKGLEFDNVWIMGCEDGVLPYVGAPEEDERRLMYVGMTRARSTLVMSSAMEEGLASRFLEEAGLM